MKVMLVHSPVGAARRRWAAEWLAAWPAQRPLWVLSHHTDAGDQLLRDVLHSRPATLGWERTTLPHLALHLARAGLARARLVPAGRWTRQALLMRVLHTLDGDGALPRLGRGGAAAPLAARLCDTLDALELAELRPRALDAHHPELAGVWRAYRRALARARLADPACVLRLACRALQRPSPPLTHAAVLLWDLPVQSCLTARLAAGLARVCARFAATLPAGDTRSERLLGQALGVPVRPCDPPRAPASALDRLQHHLFERNAPSAALDASVVVLSAGSEAAECAEIVRKMRLEAEAGVPFDRMAVFLRAPDTYRTHLREQLARADVPAYFAAGCPRPDPSGRALLTLLRCADEGLSARAFAEYLAQGVCPATQAGREAPADTGWAPPDDPWQKAALPRGALGTDAAGDAGGGGADAEDACDADAVRAGTLGVPRHWERLVDRAGVIAGQARWHRRLEALDRELEAEIDRRRAEGLAADVQTHEREQLRALQQLALPLIERLAALPGQASWGTWIAELGDIARRAIADPERVLSVLAELAPMAEVGPVHRREVLGLLEQRLAELLERSAARPAGRVYVAPIEHARGMGFGCVFIPGLAERLLPAKVVEDPVLRDEARRQISDALEVESDRIRAERLALRLAVGAAQERVVLSYPRQESERGRPRVPSFYALEVLRAAEGHMPSWDVLAQRAEQGCETWPGWSAPEDPQRATDAAEFDLAVLARLKQLPPADTQGMARYLLEVSPHLARALRARFVRWSRGWKPADGLVHPGARAKQAIAHHHPDARAYAPTALEVFASCPYRFYLEQIVGLVRREPPHPVEALDPRTRGQLLHEAQARVLRQLLDEQRLPLSPDDLGQALERLDAALDDVARAHAERRPPSIARVWEDGVQAVRRDLHGWLARLAASPAWQPAWVELGFGLRSDASRDPTSRAEAVTLSCGVRLRGSIDLVERHADGGLRATDHKTGAPAQAQHLVIGGGQTLQPVLYALALEEGFGLPGVIGSRLYYCTERGGFQAKEVPLDAAARRAASLFATTLRDAFDKGFFPAAPAPDACDRCPHRVGCGPHEDRRVARKDRTGLAQLERLRRQP